MADHSLRALQERIYQITREQELTSRVARLRKKLADAEAQLEAASTDGREAGSASSQALVEYSEDGDDELPDPIWDARDSCFRCVVCAGEVVDGECQFCDEIHTFSVNAEQEFCHTDEWTYEPFSADRLPTERSDTPLLPGFDDAVAPATFVGGDDAYRTLLRRGATVDMIDEFRLEWDPASGIIASATEELYEAWAGPAIRRGDVWKVALGRRITLQKDDIDGYYFVTELLDDCLHPAGLSVMYWETVKERRGVWVTRPKILPQAEEEAPPLPILDLEGPIAHRDDYEEESGTDDAGSEAEVDWRGEMRSGMAETTDSVYLPGGEDLVPTVEEEDGNYSTTLMSDEGEGDDQMDCDTASSATDSDEPGSDWDSQEELSGDEEAMRCDVASIRFVHHAYPQPGPH